MAIIQTIDSESQFRDNFHRMGRGNQFSYNGLGALFHYLEEVYSDDNYELDVIGLCCDFAEYTEEELVKEYKQNDEDTFEEVLEYLRDNTTVIDCGNDSYIIQSF